MKTVVRAGRPFLVAAVIVGASATTSSQATHAQVARNRQLQDAPTVGIAPGFAGGTAPGADGESSTRSDVEAKLVAALEQDEQVTGEYDFQQGSSSVRPPSFADVWSNQRYIPARSVASVCA